MTISEIGQPTWYKPDNVLQVGIYVWNTGTLAWERSTGGGGSGTTVSVDNFPATQPVSATNLDIRDLVFASDKVDASGSSVSITGAVAVTGPLTDAQLRAVSVPVSGTFWQATQPISGAISFTAPQNVIIDSSALPSGASTAARQDTGNTSLATLAGAVSGTEMQVDVLTLPAITGSVTANAGTNLNTSALALETTLSSLNAKVTAVNTGSVTVVSAPTTTVTATDLDIRNLVFATDTVDVSGSSVAVSGSVAVTGTFWQATQPISAATLPLPTGAATEAKQDTGNSSLSTIAAKDFSTETTLALIKAKTDNLDVTLSGGGTHVIVDSMPAAASAATATEEAPEYTEAASEAFSQDLSGNLRVRVSALVSDAPQPLLDNTIQPLSLTNDGRLRVATVDARVSVGFFRQDEEKMWGDLEPDYAYSGSPWNVW